MFERVRLPLGVICDALPKKALKQSELIADGAYPVVNSGRSLYGHYDDYNNDGNAIVIASHGEAGFVSYMPDKFWAGGLCHPYRSKSEDVLLTKYLYYAMKNKEKFVMDNLVDKGSIPFVNRTKIDSVCIVIPSLAVQKQVVQILDRFDSITNDIVAGIPAEIAARQKQYEYYREKLLAF